MNDYLIKTPDEQHFNVTATDSDMACLKANAHAQRHNILSCRAELLLDDLDCEKSLGTFDLDGHQLPTTWQDFQLLMGETRELAEREAAANWDYTYHRSRGVVLTAEDDQGETLITSADSEELPKTLTKYKAWLAWLQGEYSNVAKVYAEASYDSADSMYAMNNDDYQPVTGAWSALVWVQGRTDQINP